MYYYFEKYYKPIIFAVLTLVGFVYLENLRFVNQSYFWSASGIYLLLTTSFLYLDQKIIAKDKARPLLFDKYSHYANIAHHFILPIWLILSVIIMLSVNYNRNLDIAYILGASISICFCYINIKSYYENNFLLERRTHLVYDFIKIFLFIINSNIFLYLYEKQDLNITLLYIAFVLLSFILIFLISFRKGYDIKKTCITVLIGSILLVILLYWSIVILNLNVLQTGTFVTIVFYIIAAFIHHELEDTLTLTIITEYLLWVVLMISIVWGVST